jgi:hypothetical protein
MLSLAVKQTNHPAAKIDRFAERYESQRIEKC